MKIKDVMHMLNLNSVPAERVMKRPCLHCPYRKDRPNWMDKLRTLFNVTYIHRGKTQGCHMALKSGKNYECFGARVCLDGGNDQIVSPHELRTRPFSEDCVKDYGKLTGKKK